MLCHPDGAHGGQLPHRLHGHACTAAGAGPPHAPDRPPLHAFFARKDSLNYFFCYRWLLIHFKREFAFDEVCIPFA